MAGAPDSICDLLRAEGLKPDYLRPTCAFLNTQIYIAISKQTSPTAIRSWNKAFQAMKKDGTFSHIFRKYYPEIPSAWTGRHALLTTCCNTLLG